MGTNAACGVVINGREKIGMWGGDGYPSSGGQEMLQYLRNADRAVLRRLATDLKVFRAGEYATEADAEHLKSVDALLPHRLSEWTKVEWGPDADLYPWELAMDWGIESMLLAGAIPDRNAFPYDSLYCEWAYIVDLDQGVLEVHRGFQKEPHATGRFADYGDRKMTTVSGITYFPVKLIASFPLDALPNDAEWAEGIPDFS